MLNPKIPIAQGSAALRTLVQRVISPGSREPSAAPLDPDQLGRLAVQLGFLAASAYLFWTGASGTVSTELLTRPALLLAIFGLYGLAFGLAWVGLASPAPERWQWLILASLLLAVLFQYLLRTYAYQAAPTMTDAALFSDYAARLLRLGQNPYTWNMGAAFSDYRLSTYYTTPLLNGDTVTYLPHPALHFLILVPFQVLGLGDARLPQVLALLGLLWLVYRQAPHPLKGLALVPLLINWDFVNWTVGYVTDTFWAFLLVAMVVAWRRPAMRAVLYGLACAYKQPPWLLAPFLLMRLWLDDDDPDPRWQRVARFGVIAGGVFLAFNGPFIIANPGRWFAGVLDPLNGALIYYGQGASLLTQLGLLALPKSFYTLATLIICLTLMGLYGLNFRRLREAMWLFPALFMWFSYRSLQSYFTYWLLPMLAVLLNRLQPAAQRQPRSGLPAQFHPLSATVLLAGGVALLLNLTYHQFTLAPLKVELVGSLGGSSPYQINRLSLTITNTSPRALAPRVAVDTSLQPYPWFIESGPLSLAAGESGLYQVSTDLPYQMINLAQGAEVVVTDAAGDYQRRGTLKIPRDLGLLNPDAIFNAGYLRPAGGIPWGWALAESSPHLATIRDGETTSSFQAIELSFVPTQGEQNWQTVGLSQWLLFPSQDVRVWVRPPAWPTASAGQLPATAYGLEFDDGSHTLWVLFGSSTGEGQLSPMHTYFYQAAPPNQWSQQRINLPDLYRRAGWPLPPLQRIARGDLDLLTRMVTVRLLLAARAQPAPLSLSAQFGPLTIVPQPDATQLRVAEKVTDPAEYAVALGNLERRQRNFAAALAEYDRALSLNAGLTAAHFGRGEALFWLNRYVEATAAYRQAVADPAWQVPASQGLGWTLYNLGDYDQAQGYFETVIRLAPTLADAYNGLGWVWLQKHQCQTARSNFEQALALSPGLPEAQHGLETCR